SAGASPTRRFSASTRTKPFNSCSRRAAEYFAAQPPPTVNPVSAVTSRDGTKTAAEAAAFLGRGERPDRTPSRGVFVLRRALPPDKQRIMNRAALITGGSSGIGLAIGRMLKAEGYELTLASRRPDRVQAAAEELGAFAVAADVGDAEDCQRLVAEHRERFGRIDILVNSAGIGIGGRVEDLPAKHLDLQIGVNLRGLFLVTQA